MVDYRIERLKAEIEIKRAALFEARSELFKLQTAINEFTEEYNRVVGWIEGDLQDVRDEIDRLQHEREIQEAQQAAKAESIWGPGFKSFADYFKTLQGDWHKEPIRINKPRVSEDDLRAVYRKLARRFHPDTTTDPEDQKRLSVVMARINAAYSARDMNTLLKFEYQTVEEALKAIPGSDPHIESGESSLYLELVEQSHRLDDELAWTKTEYQNLKNGPMMALKIEYGIARSQGRNLFREMAARAQQELDAARAVLANLRRAAR